MSHDEFNIRNVPVPCDSKKKEDMSLILGTINNINVFFEYL